MRGCIVKARSPRGIRARALRKLLGFAVASISLAPYSAWAFHVPAHEAMTQASMAARRDAIESAVRAAGFAADERVDSNIDDHVDFLTYMSMKGAIDEDGWLGNIDSLLRPGSMGSQLRVCNHFHHPSTDHGLTYGPDVSVGTGVACSLSPGANLSSAVWAQSSENDFSWQSLNESLKSAILNSSYVDLIAVFYDLGHLIHLIQDLASPAHVRNDDHPPLDPEPDHELLWREDVIARSDRPRPDVSSLLSIPPRLALETVSNPSPIANLWDVQAYGEDSCAIAEVPLLGLAEIVASQFFSKDTFPQVLWAFGLNFAVSTCPSLNGATCPGFDPALGNPDGDMHFCYSGGEIDGNEILAFKGKSLVRGRLTADVLNSQFDRVVPLALSYSDALISHTFRFLESITVTLNDQLSILTVQNGTENVIELDRGELYLVKESADAQNVVYGPIVVPGRILPGDMIEYAVAEEAWQHLGSRDTGELFVLFHGPIGYEPHAVATSNRIDLSPTTCDPVPVVQPRLGTCEDIVVRMSETCVRVCTPPNFCSTQCSEIELSMIVPLDDESLGRWETIRAPDIFVDQRTVDEVIGQRIFTVPCDTITPGSYEVRLRYSSDDPPVNLTNLAVEIVAGENRRVYSESDIRAKGIPYDDFSQEFYLGYVEARDASDGYVYEIHEAYVNAPPQSGYSSGHPPLQLTEPLPSPCELGEGHSLTSGCTNVQVSFVHGVAPSQVVFDGMGAFNAAIQESILEGVVYGTTAYLSAHNCVSITPEGISDFGAMYVFLGVVGSILDVPIGVDIPNAERLAYGNRGVGRINLSVLLFQNFGSLWESALGGTVRLERFDDSGISIVVTDIPMISPDGRFTLTARIHSGTIQVLQ